MIIPTLVTRRGLLGRHTVNPPAGWIGGLFVASVLLALGFLSGLQAQQTAEALSLFVFDCGSTEIKDISVFSPGYDVGQSKTLVVPCYLIRHPRGMLFWDAGLPDSVAQSPEGVQRGANMRLYLKKTLMNQLEEMHVAPAAVKYVAFSHMHFDHVGNANLFTSSTLLIQEEEHQAAFGPDVERSSSKEDISLYWKLKDNDTRRLKGDYDVFGDGSVMLMAAPGHTPGHQVLFVKLPRTGPIVLSGDLYHFAKNRERRLIPSFNVDRALSYKSIDRIEAFLSRTGAALWIQHDPEQNAMIPRAPTPIQ